MSDDPDAGRVAQGTAPTGPVEWVTEPARWGPCPATGPCTLVEGWLMTVLGRFAGSAHRPQRHERLGRNCAPAR